MVRIFCKIDVNWLIIYSPQTQENKIPIRTVPPIATINRRVRAPSQNRGRRP